MSVSERCRCPEPPTALCGPTVDQLRQDFWAAGACKCDTRKALDFPTLRFGTRGSEVQILSPRPFSLIKQRFVRSEVRVAVWFYLGSTIGVNLGQTRGPEPGRRGIAEDSATWQRWIKILDFSLLGGHQSTFLGVVLVGSQLVGASAGNSRLYLFDREGELRILTDTTKRLGSGHATASIIKHSLRYGEILALMSDGGYGPLSTYAL
jgi:hypothetical protein